VTTLEEALATGRGIERSFRCTAHDDTTASASVNVIKGVWVCFACGAAGTVDGARKAPSQAMLEAMLRPERAARHYSEAWLDLFVGDATYWLTRLPAWVVRHFSLGTDPFTGAATFPVRTAGGALAGMGMRRTDEAVAEARDAGHNPARYLYPARWSAARSLYGWKAWPGTAPQMLVLTEGAADAMACWAAGVPALACYGSGLHLPQAELLMRVSPVLVVVGFDSDDAGRRGAERTVQMLGSRMATSLAHWPAKDPGDCTPGQILRALADAVGAAGYGRQQLEELRRVGRELVAALGGQEHA
jgi:Toprim-like